jgi:hypothetical protein
VQQLTLLVGQVREQRVRDQVEHLLQLLRARLLVRDEGDQGPVEVVEQLGDDLVLLPQPVDDGSRPLDPAQVREQAGVLEAVVPGDHPAVLLAVGTERPVVLAQRHPVDRRAGRAHGGPAVPDLLDEVAQTGELGP